MLQSLTQTKMMDSPQTDSITTTLLKLDDLLIRLLMYVGPGAYVHQFFHMTAVAKYHLYVLHFTIWRRKKEDGG